MDENIFEKSVEEIKEEALTYLEEKKFKLPDTLIKEYIIEGCDKNGNIQRISVTDNHQRFVLHEVDWCVSTVRFIPVSTHGCSEFRIFDFELK